jgi:murein DD-endopeptidase MepM/ murein hydrolase activator NlpD
MIACFALAACAPAPKYRAHPIEERGGPEIVPRNESVPALAITLAPPVENFTHGRITSPFGTSAVPGTRGRRHDGVDIKARAGEKVLAAADGRVTFAGRQHGYGNLVIIDHGGGVVTVYAHLFYACVRKGDRVGTGDTIGRAGKRGTATGVHLHFEVRRNGVAIDPAPYL